ncbi:chromosome segregation protein SMC [Clostridium sp. 'deep sea']|uniref:chromosome segregation protein SMC n=1 Tax=Clostridium sp. 'deep sea' TaxID=2779445 RepID=UPI0018965FE6|nr:chromosome segregation protein SMC [Clostridium sp. 'deep sea']QOR36075.1 chromosome segregation protein SMC [Clostridium sp. 'deep sea']
MYLSKCIINGFKSFADKTEIDFSKGLSAIVGPNGSGKSNIYESIMWVLGEQRAKSLRSNKMEDVIFAGSSARSEVGMAEVELVIADPECELMGIAEVRITRRLFRNGQSEYYINGKPCRLKDIAKILANTGIGKNSYSFIGQGKIEEILKSRPHELRLLFEEAAGIAHYKEQKFSTQAQLNKTQDSIQRIDDLIDELQIDVENLRVRAEKAIKHQDLTSELSEVSKELIISEFNISFNKLNNIKQKLKTLKYDLSTNEIEQESLNNILLLGETKLTELSEVKNEYEKDIIRLDNTVENYKNKLAELSENLSEINNSFDNKSNEKTELTQTQSSTAAQIENTKRDIKVLSYSLNNNNQQVVDLTEQIKLLKEQITELDIISLEQEKSSSEQKIGSLLQKADNISERINLENEQLNTNLVRYDELVNKYKIDSNLLNELKEKLNHSKDTYAKSSKQDLELTKIIKQNQQQLNELSQRLVNLREQKRNLFSELTLNQKLKSEYTGYYAGVKSVLLAKKNNPSNYQGLVGVVAELINVPENLQVAISAVLGGQSQYLVSETARDATKAINMLKEKRAGKATFLPLDRVVPRINTIPNPVQNNPNFMGRAIDLIDYENKAEIAIKYLLNNVLVFNSVESALQASKLKLTQFLIVTTSGEVFSGKGLISGGRNKKDHNAELIARNKKIAKLQAGLQQNQQQLANCENSGMALKNQLKKQVTELENLKKQLIELSKSITHLEKQEFFTQTLINKMNEEMVSLKNKEAKLGESIRLLNLELISTNDLIKSSSGNLQASNDELSKARALMLEYNQKQSKEAELRAEIRLLENKIYNSKENIKTLEQNKETIDKQLSKLTVELNAQQQKINEIQETYNHNLFEFDEWQQKLFTKTENLKEVTSNFIKASEQQVTNGDKLKTLQINKEQINRSLQRYDRRLVEQETIHKFIEAELYQANINKDECLVDNNITTKIVEQLKLKVNKLKNMINNLGDVDYGAIADLKRREERISFLNQQKSDLEDSKQKLAEVINEVDKICYDKLAETIEVVRANFKEIYIELFQGGYADIYWDNEEDIFSSGIILKVSPPGKKVQNMDQLSGGEKSLTAIALLMSFTKMKTSSFCIFDEVDAALDETNNIRLASYWQTISKTTQVLAVTHSRHTMVHADNLYGVVMQEKGVSKIISVTLD